MDAATGALAVPKDLLRTSLATCTAFRQWDGLSLTVEQAKDRIYFDALPPPSGNVYTKAELVALRPFAIVYTSASDGLQFVQESSAALGGSFVAAGALIVRLERNFPDVSAEADPAAAADRQFENFLGPLMRSEDANSPGLLELAGQAGYLVIRQLSLMAGPMRCDPKDVTGLGDHQVAFLEVQWGRTS